MANRYPYSVYIDTGSINGYSRDPAVTELEHFLKERGGAFQKTSVMDTELLKGKDKVRLKKSSGFIESLEPAVWGQSRWGHSTWTSPKESQRLDLVVTCLLGPDPERRASAKFIEHQRMDALHLFTAGKHGGHYFVTREKAILRKADEIKSLCGGLLPCSPEDCLAALKKFDRFANSLSDHQE